MKKSTSGFCRMTNLAMEPEHAETRHRLKANLDTWMKQQGDRGVTSERQALLHQGRYRNMTLEQAEQAWRKRNNK